MCTARLLALVQALLHLPTIPLAMCTVRVLGMAQWFVRLLLQRATMVRGQVQSLVLPLSPRLWP